MKNIRLFLAIIFTAFSLNVNAMNLTKKPCNLQKNFLKDLTIAILENPNEKETLYKMLPQETKKELLKAEKYFNINMAINKAIDVNPEKQNDIIKLAPKLILAGFIKQELTDFLLEEFGTANPRPFKAATGTLPQAFLKAIAIAPDLLKED